MTKTCTCEKPSVCTELQLPCEGVCHVCFLALPQEEKCCEAFHANPNPDWTTQEVCDCKCHTHPTESNKGWEEALLLGGEIIDYEGDLRRNGKGKIIKLLQTATSKAREDSEEKYEQVFAWLLGQSLTSGFKERRDDEGAYWWRKELRERLEEARKSQS